MDVGVELETSTLILLDVRHGTIKVLGIKPDGSYMKAPQLEVEHTARNISEVCKLMKALRTLARFRGATNESFHPDYGMRSHLS
jgi:hypothetical protein